MEDLTRHCPFTQFAHRLLENNVLCRVVDHLQHQSGFNINIIFYLTWLARAQYGRLSKQNLKTLQQEIMMWHQRVVAELKYTYALVVDSEHNAAPQIKQALQEEIVRAHIIEQCMLYETKLKPYVLTRNPYQQLSDACVSMIRYAELKNDLLIDEDQEACIQLFACVFEEIGHAEIEKQVAAAFDQLKKSHRQAQMTLDEM